MVDFTQNPFLDEFQEKNLTSYHIVAQVFPEANLAALFS
jgi:hypothetical protein